MNTRVLLCHLKKEIFISYKSNQKKTSGTYIIFKIPAKENTPSCPEMQIWTSVSISAITGPAYL